MDLPSVVSPLITIGFLLTCAVLSFVGLGIRRSMDDLRDAVRSQTVVLNAISIELAASQKRDSDHRRAIDGIAKTLGADTTK